MQTLVLMRYSYFGMSGWRSRASRDVDQLLSSDRLAQRIRLFENLALRSLADQTDDDFKLIVLSSAAMPKWRRRQLTSLCKDTLGDARADVIFRRPGTVHRMFKTHIHKIYGDAPVTCQVVLDDDDAFSSDFIEHLKPEADAAFQTRPDTKHRSFLSFPEGLTLKLGDDKPQIFTRDVPFTNLGFSLVAPTSEKYTVFGLAHKKVKRRHPARVIYRNAPMYVRTVHDSNDSRALFTEDPVQDRDMPEILTRFPCLGTYFSDKVTTKAA